MDKIIGRNYKGNFSLNFDKEDLESTLKKSLFELFKIINKKSNPILEHIGLYRNSIIAIFTYNGLKISAYIEIDPNKTLDFSIYGKINDDKIVNYLEKKFKANILEINNIHKPHQY